MKTLQKAPNFCFEMNESSNVTSVINGQSRTDRLIHLTPSPIAVSTDTYQSNNKPIKMNIYRFEPLKAFKGLNIIQGFDCLRVEYSASKGIVYFKCE